MSTQRPTILSQTATEVIVWWPGFTLPSAANLREHWAVRAKRVKSQRGAALMLWRATMPTDWALPVSITLSRVSPRQLDGHDNLRSASKAVVDGISDALKLDDRTSGLHWDYRQRKGKPHEVALEVRIVKTSCGTCGKPAPLERYAYVIPTCFECLPRPSLEVVPCS